VSLALRGARSRATGRARRRGLLGRVRLLGRALGWGVGEEGGNANVGSGVGGAHSPALATLALLNALTLLAALSRAGRAPGWRQHQLQQCTQSRRLCNRVATERTARGACGARRGGTAAPPREKFDHSHIGEQQRHLREESVLRHIRKVVPAILGRWYLCGGSARRHQSTSPRS